MIKVPSGWDKKKLEEVAKIQTGIAKGKKGIENPIELPYLRVANVQDGYLDLSEIKTITISKDQLDRYLLQKGDVLLTEGGDYDKLGRGTIWRGQISPCLHQNHVFAVRTNKNQLLSQFFAYQAASSYGKRYFLSCAKQTTNLASINSSQLKKYPVIIPCLSEQKRIVEIIEAWDGAIAIVEQLITAKQKLKKALLVKLLGRKTSLLDPAKERETVKQGEVATFYNGRAYKLSEWETEGTPVVRLQNLTGSGTEYYYSNLKLPERQYVENGDLLYMWSATFGPHIWQGERAIYHYHIWKVECSERIEKLYLYYVLDYLTSRWMSSTNGMGLLHITKGTMEKQKIPLPSIEEQKLIANILQECDREISMWKNYFSTLQEQKQGLMQKLLTGDWRVPVEEVAA